MHLLPRSSSPMEVLRTIVSTLSSFDPNPEDKSAGANYGRAIRLTAALGTSVTSWEHIRNGMKPVAPLPDHNTATNFLYMLNGEMPDDYTANALDTALVLHADHELNASTFAARVTAGTLADIYSSSVYYMLGFPIDLDTPIFACSRIAGYTAHVLEQYANTRLIRPRAEYVGQKVTEYVPIEQRG